MRRIMQEMREEQSTMRSCLGTIEDFRRYFQKRLDHMAPADIRRYQAHLLEERSWASAPSLITWPRRAFST